MAFSYTTLRRTIIGNMRLVIGTFATTDTTTGGTIATGLKSIEIPIVIDTSGTRAGMSVSVSGGNITIAGLTATDAGYWMAIGR